MSINWSGHPNLKTLEEFCAFYEKDTPENKAYLFRQYLFAIKERERLREKDKVYREKKKAERAALPPQARKRPGRPRKHPLPSPNTPAPDAGISPK